MPGLRQIKFDNFIAGQRAGVLDIAFDGDGIAGFEA